MVRPSDFGSRPGPKPDIADLAKAVDEAKNHLEMCRGNEAAARRQATDALNRFNEASRLFDAKVAELRTEAPKDTDWSRSRNTPITPMVRGSDA